MSSPQTTSVHSPNKPEYLPQSVTTCNLFLSIILTLQKSITPNIPDAVSNKYFGHGRYHAASYMQQSNPSYTPNPNNYRSSRTKPRLISRKVSPLQPIPYKYISILTLQKSTQYSSPHLPPTRRARNTLDRAE